MASNDWMEHTDDDMEFDPAAALVLKSRYQEGARR